MPVVVGAVAPLTPAHDAFAGGARLLERRSQIPMLGFRDPGLGPQATQCQVTMPSTSSVAASYTASPPCSVRLGECGSERGGCGPKSS